MKIQKNKKEDTILRRVAFQEVYFEYLYVNQQKNFK